MTYTTVSAPNTSALSYSDIYDLVQTYVKTEHAGAFSSNHTDIPLLTDIIHRYFISHGFSPSEYLRPLSEKLALDMGGTSFLSRYLDHLDNYPTLEEININAWNSIVLRYSDRPDEWLEDTFVSPDHVVQILNKIKSDTNGKQLNPANPISIGYVFTSVREASIIAPVAPKDVGAYSSIRIVRPSPLSRKAILLSGCMTEEMLDFVIMCMKNSVNMLLGGKPRAGKTTMLNYLLSILAEDKDVRIGITEEGSREVALTTYDENGRPQNQVLSFLTYPPANIDSNELVNSSLRVGLDVNVVQEMRSGEAYVAVKTANTGMGVYSTIHCNDCESTYYRGVDLMEEGSTQPEPVLMRKLVRGFPIVAYFKRMKDGVRRCMEIMEGTLENGELRGRTLYRFVTHDTLTDADGKYRVIGHFEKVNDISVHVQRILLNNGVGSKELERFLKAGVTA